MCYANEKKAQVQAYLKVSGDVKHPLHEKVGIKVHSKEGRSGGTKHRKPSLSVVMCNRSEIVPGNRFASAVNGQKRLSIFRLTP